LRVSFFFCHRIELTSFFRYVVFFFPLLWSPERTAPIFRCTILASDVVIFPLPHCAITFFLPKLGVQGFFCRRRWISLSLPPTDPLLPCRGKKRDSNCLFLRGFPQIPGVFPLPFCELKTRPVPFFEHKKPLGPDDACFPLFLPVAEARPLFCVSPLFRSPHSNLFPTWSRCFFPSPPRYLRFFFPSLFSKTKLGL